MLLRISLSISYSLASGLVSYEDQTVARTTTRRRTHRLLNNNENPKKREAHTHAFVVRRFVTDGNAMGSRGMVSTINSCVRAQEINLRRADSNQTKVVYFNFFSKS